MNQPDTRRVSIPTLAEIFFGRLANVWRKRRAQRSPAGRRLQFHAIEPRILLSADLVLADLVFDAPVNSADDTFTLRFNSDNGNLEVLDGGTLARSQALAETTAVIINGEVNQGDRLIIDFGSGGFFSVSGGIHFNGGTGISDLDALVVTGGSFTTATHTFTTTGPEHSGNIVYDDGAGTTSTISYTGLEPIDMSGSTIENLVFNLSGTADLAILEDDGNPGNGFSQIRSQSGTPTFDTTTFSNPASSLTVNMGGDDGTFTVASPDSTFTAALTINGQAGLDTVVFAGTVGFAALSVTVGGSITDDANADIDVAGNASLAAGAITLGDEAGNVTNFGTLTFVGGAVIITEDSSTLLSGASTAGSLSLTAAGSITDDADADLGVTGNASLAAAAITLGGLAGNVTNFGSLTFNATVAVSITEDSATVLSGASTAGSLILTAAIGTITDDADADIDVTRSASFTAAGAITLGELAGNVVNFGTLTFASLAVNITEDSATVLSGRNSASILTLVANGSITDDANASLGIAAAARFTAAGPITLGDLAGNVTNFGSLTFNATDAVSITEDSATILSGGSSASVLSLVANGSIVDDADADIDVTENAGFTAVGLITLGDQAGNVTNFGSLTFNATGAVGISEDSSTVLTGVSRASSLSLTVAGSITDDADADINVTGNASLVSGGAITLGDQAGNVVNFGTLTFVGPPIFVGGDVSISEDSATVLSGVSSASRLTLTAAGSISDDADADLDVAADASFAASGVIILGDQAGNVTNLGSLTFNATGAVSISEDSDTIVRAGIVSNNDVNLSSAGSLVIIEGLSAGTGDIRLVANTVNQAVAGVITADELGILTANVTLVAAVNDVNTLAVEIMSGFIGHIAVRDGDDLTIGVVAAGGGAGFTGATGIVSNGSDVDLEVGNLIVHQALNAGVGADVRLVAGTTVEQFAGGAITANELGIRAGGDVLLATAANDVNTLAVASTGLSLIEFRDSDDLTIGTVTAQVGFITTSGIISTGGDINLNVGSLSVDSSLDSGTHDIALTAPGGVFFTANAIVNVDLGGIDSSEFTNVAISHAVSLAGPLDVDLVNGFTPGAGNRFPFMTFTSKTGFFDVLPENFIVERSDTELALVFAPQPSISINDVSVVEGDSGVTNFIFNVSLSNPFSQTVTVDYSTADGTASAGSDYHAGSGVVTFAPGETLGTITIAVNGDLTYEFDQIFLLNLANPLNATLADPQGVGTIVNDDAAPQLFIGDVRLVEGDSGTTNAVFTVGLAGATEVTATVSFSTADGTASAGSDYTATSGSLIFQPGESTQTITVAVNGDVTVEADETFLVNLSSPTNAVISDGQGVGTITNDDTAVYTINDVTVNEADGTLSFTVSVSNPVDIPVSIDVSYTDQSATGAAGGVGADYDNNQDQMVFAALDTADKTVTVAITNDSIAESTETFLASLSTTTALGGRSVDTSDQGIGTILDNDAPTGGIDLVGAVEWDPDDLLIPGDREHVTVVVFNRGDTAVHQLVKVKLYASVDQALDDSDIFLDQRLTGSDIEPESSSTAQFNLVFPSKLLPGTYFLLAEVDPADEIAESDEENNTASGGSFDFHWMFGQVPGHGWETLTVRDGDGTWVNFSLLGPGTGEITVEITDEKEEWDLVVTGTTGSSILSILTLGGGDRRVTLDDIHVTGALRGILAPKMDLTGTLAIDGALGAGMMIGSATEAVIAVETILGSRLLGLGVQGIAILGDLEDSQILIGADLGADGQLGGDGADADTYSDGDLGDLLITGCMVSSYVRVGQDPVDGIFDNGDDVLLDGSIDSITIRGEMTDDSYFVADDLPRYARIDGEKIYTATDPRFWDTPPSSDSSGAGADCGIDWNAHAGSGWGAGYSPFATRTGSGQSNFADFLVRLFG